MIGRAKDIIWEYMFPSVISLVPDARFLIASDIICVSSSFDSLVNAAREVGDGESALKSRQLAPDSLDGSRYFFNESVVILLHVVLPARQREYFRDGDRSKLRPMILKDIADRTGLDVSTISRVVNSKYVQTQFGIILLKSLFSEAMQTQSGEEVSSYEVKNILQEAIDSENKRDPLTDEQLMNILNEKGYRIARRTVAKYREMLDIPVARLRKQI